MNDEYDKYTIDELHDMLSADDPDAMDDLADGWANAAAMLSAVKEALGKHWKALDGKWTSNASGVFASTLQGAVEYLHAAHSGAEANGKATAELASYSRWAKDTIAKTHDDWQTAKNGNYQQYLKAAEEYGGNPSAFIFKHGSSPVEPGSADEAILRMPFDESAKKDMKTALKHYTDAKASYAAPLPKYKPVAPPPKKYLPGDPSGWGKDGRSGENADHVGGLAATSFGGNSLGSHGPALQNGPTSAPVTPTPGGGPVPPTPGPTMGPVPGGLPVGGVPPLGKAPTPPVLRPTTPVESPPLGRTGPTAPRTPGLPSRANPTGRGVPTRNPGGRATRNGGSEEIEPTNRAGRTASRVRGAVNEEAEPTTGRGGRGLVKSRMEAVDRTGQPRRANEVLGRRSPSKPAVSAEETAERAPLRRTMRSVIRGAKQTVNGRSISYAEPEPVDNTARGYSRSTILGARNRVGGFTRNPMVAKKLNPGDGVRIFGKREEPISDGRRLLLERKAAVARRRAEADGLSRPVIRQGVTRPAELEETAKPPAEDDGPENLWTAPTTVTPIVGKRRPAPEFEHDPGPGVITGRGEGTGDKAAGTHDPGPTAFTDRRADKTNWPQ